MLITSLLYYYGSMAVCYLFKCLLLHYLITMVVWLCVYLFKCLLPYYLITMVVWLCVYPFKCLLSYYLITLLPYYYGSMAVGKSLTAYYHMTIGGSMAVCGSG